MDDAETIERNRRLVKLCNPEFALLCGVNFDEIKELLAAKANVEPRNLVECAQIHLHPPTTMTCMIQCTPSDLLPPASLGSIPRSCHVAANSASSNDQMYTQT
jgi:hypothetical protein